MAIVESESDLMMGWLIIRTFYNSPSIPDYSGKADALIRLKRAMRKFMREQPPCREWIVKDYYDGSCIQLEQLFTNWFKLTRRRGHWFAYHSIGRDV